MLRRRASLLLLSAGCASSAGSVEPPRTDVTIDEPLAASTLPALGVAEAATGAANAERAVRSVTTEVGACLKPAVDREPELRGTMIFRIEPGASVPIKPASGTLSSLPAAACIRDALRGVKSEAAIDYSLTLKGNPQPLPLPAGAGLSDDWVVVDWSGADAPAAFAKSGDALRDRFRRCAFAAEPILSEKVWLAAGVAKGGAATVGLGKPGDASDCIQRALRTTTFPDAGHDYAFSVMLRPLSKQEVAQAEDDRQEFGMVGLLNPGAGSVEGDAFGAGGLGLTGIGQGGGGTGIGLGGIGTIGHGNTTGQGFGNGNGRLGGAHPAKPPSVKMGATSVAGRLPPEVIQRIVRQNFGRFRLCYENGLRKDANLAGKVSVSFEITRQGDTSKVSSTSDLKDKSVAACVERAFAGLSFPQPEGGVVKVTYPIMFSPGDTPAGSAGGTGGAPSKPAAPPTRTIDGKPLAAVSLVDVEKRLLAKGFEVARVPGSGEVPALFINDEANRQVYALTLEPPRAGIRGPLCKAGSEDRQLYIRGYHCERVMEPLLD